MKWLWLCKTQPYNNLSGNVAERLTSLRLRNRAAIIGLFREGLDHSWLEVPDPIHLLAMIVQQAFLTHSFWNSTF